MKGISGFFDKFKNVALKELRKREIIVDSIYKITKQKIDIKDIEIKNGTILVKGNNGFKSELFLKKKLILDQIVRDGGIKVVDIK